MSLPEFCIRRPVAAAVINLLIILLGVVSFQRLNVREYPAAESTSITVQVSYAGAGPEIMESQVTKPIEDQLAGLEGIDFVTSDSRFGTARVSANFKLGRNPDAAAADVRDRVARVRGQLPEDIDEPVISKTEADAQPIIYISFSSDRASALEVSDYADTIVRPRLENISGVSSVNIFGERRWSMRVWVDRDRLAAYNLTTQDIETAIRSQNLQLPSGRVESQDREFSVLVNSDLEKPEQFGNIVVKVADNAQVRLKDVARVELGAKDERTLTRLNGQQAVALGVVKNATANPLDISAEMQRVLPQIQSQLPEGMKLEVGYDTTLFISQSIKSVQETIFDAVLLVVVVILVFLRSLRATIIPLLAIPISLIGACAIMYALGFSINTLTLLAFVLAIGLVVDDAIVVLENISRHIEEGMKPYEAGLRGAREIVFAIIGMTITLAAVFTPIAFSTGITGKLFTEFALTLAGAVLVSGVVALTLTPMLCARFLNADLTHSKVYRKTEPYFEWVRVKYSNLLGRVLNYRVIVAISLVGVGLAAIFISSRLARELAPLEDRNIIFTVVSGPDGATLDYMQRYVGEIEAIYMSMPEMQRTFIVLGTNNVNQGFAIMTLKPWDQRHRSQFDITGQLFGQFMGIPGINAFPINLPSLGQRGIGRPISFVLQTTGTYDKLQGAVNTVMEKMNTSGLFQGPDSDLRLSTPELDINVNRDKLLTLGVPVGDVANTLQSMLASRDVTRFKRNGQQYDVVVQIADVDRHNPDDVSRIFVRAGDGQMIQLSNLVDIKETVKPRELSHFNKLRAATISATLAPGIGLGQALDFLESSVKDINDPALLYDYSGVSRDYKTTSSELLGLFVLGLMFIYLVLAAQFESFVDPVIILLSVPLALFGAILTLWIFGGTLNIYSQIGLLSLIGLLAKHGILIVEFANHGLERGLSKIDAVKEAAGLRLRPILMTTAAMVFGALPLAIATGAGAMAQRQIGQAIVGGLTIGTFFTLFVVPCMYVLLSRKKPARVPAASREAMSAAE
ncbi:MAG: efflux RND transporter permease subunit [Pseudomonadota bacterium]